MIFICRIATTREENPIRERKKMQRVSRAETFLHFGERRGFCSPPVGGREARGLSFACPLGIFLGLFFGPAKKSKGLFRAKRTILRTGFFSLLA
ncbi:MAG: hypothetical protein U5N56_04130 [Candidatus Marinimicrobia bacterium]|nr:hypothetical protein [Candidatus Neomarinimicrobiota bacterium]